MTGAKDLSHGVDADGQAYLSMRIGRNSASVTHVRVTLCHDDTYTGRIRVEDGPSDVAVAVSFSELLHTWCNSGVIATPYPPHPPCPAPHVGQLRQAPSRRIAEPQRPHKGPWLCCKGPWLVFCNTFDTTWVVGASGVVTTPCCASGSVLT